MKALSVGSLWVVSIIGLSASLLGASVPGFADRGSTVPPMDQLQSAIDGGLSFLAGDQQASGHFTLERWNRQDDQAPRFQQTSPFATTHVVSAINGIDQPAVHTIVERALAALSDDQGPDGFWKFIVHADPASARMPPDVEDTALSAGLLRRAGRLRVQPDLLPYRDERGRFITWMFPHGAPTAEELAFYSGPPLFYERRAPNETDCVVNVNALFYYGSLSQPPQATCKYVNEMTQQRGFPACSLYYARAYPIWGYVVARAYHAGASCLTPSVPVIRQQVLASRNAQGSWGDSFTTALAVATLLALGERPATVAPAIERLLAARGPDGGWNAEPFFVENLTPDIVFGSRALTTATVLEALAGYHQALVRGDAQ